MTHPMTVPELLELRHRHFDGYLNGKYKRAKFNEELAAIEAAIAVTLPGDAAALAELFDKDSKRRHRRPKESPAARARREYRERNRPPEPDRPEVPAGAYEAALAERISMPAAKAWKRVAKIAARPVPAPEPTPWYELPESDDVTYTVSDRLSWEEFAAGVPCQGCGLPFTDPEYNQRDGETYPEWSARRQAAFVARHPDCKAGQWSCLTDSDDYGPRHCRRCCAPHPLSPDQIRRLNAIVNPPVPLPAAPVVPWVRMCGTCHKPKDAGHRCRLEDLPERLRAIVEQVVDDELKAPGRSSSRAGRPAE